MIILAKNLYRINCCFLNHISLAGIDFCYFPYLEMVNPILVMKLGESPLEMFPQLDYGQTSSAICNKTSNLNSRFHISDLCKSIGLFNLFGNETINTFTDMPCDHIYTLRRCIVLILQLNDRNWLLPCLHRSSSQTFDQVESVFYKIQFPFLPILMVEIIPL